MCQRHRDVHRYLLLKAQLIHTASLPGASRPACLAKRGDGQSMPQVEVRAPPQETADGSPGKRPRENEEAETEVVAAVAAYVVAELKADLLVELMELMPFREPTLEIPGPA